MNCGILCLILIFAELETDAVLLRNLKIIRGRYASEGEFPFVASLQGRDGSNVCGGTVISEWHVLTTCHCLAELDGDKRPVLRNTTAYRVTAGSVNRCRKRAAPLSWVYDLGIIQVNSSFNFTGSVKPIGLVQSHVTDSLIDNGAVCYAMGWGTQTWPKKSVQNGEKLRVTEVKLIGFPECRHMLCQYDPNYCEVNIVEDAHLCTRTLYRGSSECSGDSGGPLVCEGNVVGITSWSFGCGVDNAPMFYTRLDLFQENLMEVLSAASNALTFNSVMSVGPLVLAVKTYLMHPG